MPSPVKVSEIAELVPGAGDSICTALVKCCIKLPVRWLQIYNYLFASDGSINSGFAADLCDVRNNCPP